MCICIGEAVCVWDCVFAMTDAVARIRVLLDGIECNRLSHNNEIRTVNFEKMVGKIYQDKGIMLVYSISMINKMKILPTLIVDVYDVVFVVYLRW